MYVHVACSDVAFFCHRTAVKDRIVAFLLFLGKIAITAAVGKSFDHPPCLL